ncbi:hypothetical protein ACFFOM_12010 [Microlunatus capsulatus]|uniref:Uncharacterized protein n=1 Tax=Microlunatus capsulatus TaxID=99117 RepID=A0ABS4Z969_9ACTN|nr:hypothetical protein [Microlunatus capsulatus]MBP2417531.1 hypothetical protein [Microlunatus capsulatus]
MTEHPTGSWTRRSALALGLSAAALLVAPARAATTEVRLGALAFAVPAGLLPVDDPGLGSGWQWRGAGPGRSPVVLARAELAAISPEEVLALVLAGAGAGLLPGLRLGPRRRRTTPGAAPGDAQLRAELGWRSAAGRPARGTLLAATRVGGPAALVAVLGDATLTAGTVDAVLDSVRWTR